MPRLIAAFAHTVDAVAAVAYGAVHADLLAWIVLALGSAHHRSCKKQTTNETPKLNIRVAIVICLTHA